MNRVPHGFYIAELRPQVDIRLSGTERGCVRSTRRRCRHPRMIRPAFPADRLRLVFDTAALRRIATLHFRISKLVLPNVPEIEPQRVRPFLQTRTV